MTKNTRQGNRAGRSCVAENRSSALTSDWAMTMLRTKLPELADEILARLGTYSRGPRKGLQKGYLHWRKVSEGGWNYREHRVELPGSSMWRVLDGPDPERSVDIGLLIERERIAAEQKAKEAHWTNLGPVGQMVHLALNSRRVAMINLHESRDHMEKFGEDFGALESFHHYMARARERVQSARALRNGEKVDD